MFPGGKMKAFTLSYDDGVVQDIRLIDIMNKYGLKGTFNINAGLFQIENAQRGKFDGRLKLSEAKDLYTDSGHEIAIHGYVHKCLAKISEGEATYDVIHDREVLEKEFGGIIDWPYEVEK